MILAALLRAVGRDPNSDVLIHLVGTAGFGDLFFVVDFGIERGAVDNRGVVLVIEIPRISSTMPSKRTELVIAFFLFRSLSS